MQVGEAGTGWVSPIVDAVSVSGVAGRACEKVPPVNHQELLLSPSEL